MAAKQTNLHLGILLGMTLEPRKGELLALKFSYFDFEANTVKFPKALGRDRYSDEEYEIRKKSRSLTKAEKLLKTEESDGRVVVVPKFVIDEVLKRKEVCDANRERYADQYSSEDYVLCN